MCRMLAFASREPGDAAAHLAALARFSLSGRLVAGWERYPGGNHPDGWGIAYRDRSGIRVVRGGAPANADPRFAGLSVVTDRFLGHVRYASNRATVDAANAHPFRIGTLALAHNGTFRGAVGEAASARGVSDTLVFLERLDAAWTDRERQPLRDVLSDLLAEPALVGDYSAANLLVAAGGALYALRDFRRHPDYYTLWLRDAPGEATVASEPFGDPAGWRALENGEFVALEPRG